MQLKAFSIHDIILLLAIALAVAGFFHLFSHSDSKKLPLPKLVSATKVDTVIKFERLVLHDTVTHKRKLFIPDSANKILVNKLISERDSLECLLDSMKVKETLLGEFVTDAKDTVKISVNTLKNTFDSTLVAIHPRTISIPKETLMIETERERAWYESPWTGFAAGVVVTLTGLLLMR